MSNSRVFDYTEISNLYNKMNTITGDKSDPTSIAGILEKINLDYTDVVHGVVGENEMAIFGELGQQMLLNWENTSANFPNFVENFSAWSTLVAQAAGDYSAFEQQVQGIKTANPLGWASGGMQDSFITTSVYADSLSEQELAELAAYSEFHQLTGATYIDTGMVSYLKKADFWEGVELAMDVVSVVGAFKTVKALAPQIKAARAMVTPTMTGAGNAGTNYGFDQNKTTRTLKNGTKKTTYHYNYENGPDARNVDGLISAQKGNNPFYTLRGTMTNAGDAAADAAMNKTGFLKKIFGTKLGTSMQNSIAHNTNLASRGKVFVSNLGKGAQYSDVARGVLAESFKAVDPKALNTALALSSGGATMSATSNLIQDGIQNNYASNNVINFGTTVQIGNDTYDFFAQTPGGVNIVADDNGNLLYQDANGGVQPVMISSGGSYVAATFDNTDDTMNLYAGTENLGQANTFNYQLVLEDNVGYYDTLSANLERLNS